MRISLLVNALDSQGGTGWEQVETLLISLHGGMIRTRQEFPTGTTLEIRMCDKDRTTRARVAWMKSVDGGKGFELGFEVDEPGFWEINFPPDRWQAEERPHATRH